MATDSPSGEYRTLSERLEAEKYQAGAYSTLTVDNAGVVDINALIPEAVPALSIRKDAWNNVYLRGALFVDFDTLVDEDEIDYTGVTQQPGSFDVFTVPEGYRPLIANGFGVTIAVQNDSVTFNVASFLRVATTGVVSLSVGGYLADGVTTTLDALAGSTLSVVVAGDYSLN